MEKEQSKMHRDLIVMIGMTLSGKTYHVDKNYLPEHQIVSLAHLKQAMKYTKFQNNDFIYASMELMVRSLMLKGMPIIVDENNSTIESLFMWKSMSREHGYNLKAVFIDTPLTVCLARLKYLLKDEPVTEEMQKKLAIEYERINELKEILKMKHQTVVDDVTFITYDGG